MLKGNIAFKQVNTDQAVERTNFRYRSQRAVDGLLATAANDGAINANEYCSLPFEYNNPINGDQAWWNITLDRDYVISDIYVHNSIVDRNPGES